MQLLNNINPSGERIIGKRVRQECCLSPTLFNKYLDEIFEIFWKE